VIQKIDGGVPEMLSFNIATVDIVVAAPMFLGTLPSFEANVVPHDEIYYADVSFNVH